LHLRQTFGPPRCSAGAGATNEAATTTTLFRLITLDEDGEKSWPDGRQNKSGRLDETVAGRVAVVEKRGTNEQSTVRRDPLKL